MFLENSYVRKDTLVHNLNPIIKFLIFLSIIFLLFLKIGLFTQLCLILFVVAVSVGGDCTHVLRRSAPLYVFLFFFLLTVNFFFLKSPGFYAGNALAEYRDILDLSGAKRPISTDDQLSHSWFFGGQILSETNGKPYIFDKMECLNRVLGWSTDACGHDSHTHSGTVSQKWQIFSLSSGEGGTKYAAFLPVWYTFSLFQIVNAFGLANKIILIIILSSVFSITSSLPSFTYALEDLFRPFRVLKLPSRVMALAVAISIRFAPSLITEAFRIIRAQASRGIDYKNGKFRDKLSALLSLFVPLFVISFLKSKELAEAMRARGYDHNHSRTSFRSHIVTKFELLIFSLSLFFITSLYYWFFNGYYFGPFGSVERMLLLAK